MKAEEASGRRLAVHERLVNQIRNELPQIAAGRAAAAAGGA